MTIHKAGEKIGGRYLIKSFVDEGGMQEVYKVDDLLLSRQVALKVPKNSSAEKRFKRSAVVSASINHANVAKTLDYLEENGRAYLVEEYIEGKDLRRILRENIPALDPLLAARIFHHLAKGLAASHHATVIHRDLKPSNVMAVGGPSVQGIKITDFGIAKMAEEEIKGAIDGGESSLSASSTALGAIPYMSPEMITSATDASTPTDVWSIGALMFELVAGRKPFGAGYKAIPDIIAGKVPAFPQFVTSNPQFKPLAEEIHSIIAACLKVDPTKRPTADQLVTRCEQLCYPNAPREFGKISQFPNSAWGFIVAESGPNLFFHVDSIFGESRPKIGDRVSFCRHKGEPKDRAFPLLKAI